MSEPEIEIYVVVETDRSKVVGKVIGVYFLVKYLEVDGLFLEEI